MPDARRLFGTAQEKLAAEFLERKGMRVLRRQYQNHFGEIDLICEDGSELVFVEVKARRSETYGYPEEAVTRNKIRHIMQTADIYLQEEKIVDRPWRVDVVAIRYLDGKEPEIIHFPAIDMN